MFLEQFSVSRSRRTALNLCFCAIPDGKPLRTFPGIALAQASESGTFFAGLPNGRRGRPKDEHQPSEKTIDAKLFFPDKRHYL
ncbi:hypothetical protein FJ423_22250 [Mesorhizobium sp. B2-8-9]|nr:hypothetical protein FJ423_22250 [Mesorhizobium sp. B2-8-9]